jgi:hypothetical protein
MSSLLVLALALGAPAGGAADAYAVIADGAPKEADAKAKLAALRKHTELRLAEGFPRLVKSDTLAGLKPGLFIVVLGFCPVERRVSAKTGQDDAVMSVDLRYQDYLRREFARLQPGTYLKKVTGARSTSCPQLLFAEPSDKAGRALWAALQAQPRAPEALLAYGVHLETEVGDFDAADYVYSWILEMHPGFEPAQHRLAKLEFVGARDLP